MNVSVEFPGAVNSKFTTNMDFARPSQKVAMPTYRVLGQDGTIVDKDKDPPDIGEAELIKMYKDMVTGLFVNLRSNQSTDRISEHHGLDHVRCPEARQSQLLYGTTRWTTCAKCSD